MITQGPVSWMSLIACHRNFGSGESPSVAHRSESLESREITVHVPAPPPADSTCHCERIGLAPSSQFWEWRWFPSSIFIGSSPGMLAWVNILSCLFISLSIIRACVFHILWNHRSEVTHLLVQTSRPSLQYGFAQTSTRMVSVGVQTDFVESTPQSSAVLGLTVPSAQLGDSRGITTPSRQKQWQQPSPEC